MFDRQNFIHSISSNTDVPTLACDYFDQLMCVYDIVPMQNAQYILGKVDTGILELKIGLVDNSTANWFRSIIKVVPVYNKYGRLLTIVPSVNNNELNLIIQ